MCAKRKRQAERERERERAKRNIARRSLLIGSALRANRRQLASRPASASASASHHCFRIGLWPLAEPRDPLMECGCCWLRWVSLNYTVRCLLAKGIFLLFASDDDDDAPLQFFPPARCPLPSACCPLPCCRLHVLQITADNGSAKSTRIWIILTPPPTHTHTYFNHTSRPANNIPNPALGLPNSFNVNYVYVSALIELAVLFWLCLSQRFL